MRLQNKRIKSIVLLLLLLALVILTSVLWKRKQSAHVRYLPNGMKVELLEVQSGKEFKMFRRGEPWQKSIFKVFGTNLPPRFRGDGHIYPSRFKSGSVAVSFRFSGISARMPSLTLNNQNTRWDSTRRIESFESDVPGTESMQIVATWEIAPIADEVLLLNFEWGDSSNLIEFVIPNPLPL